MILFSTAENYILEDERVLLRPLSEKDFTHLLPFAENEAGLWKHSMVSAAGEEGMKKYIEKTMRIPMIDGIRCLNLSNAVSILAYEVLRHTNFEHLKETSERLLGD